MDIGIFRLPFTCGCVVYVISLFLAAQTTEFYQVVLAQGILLGISAGGASSFPFAIQRLANL
jgi:hypothetical protein